LLRRPISVAIGGQRTRSRCESGKNAMARHSAGIVGLHQSAVRQVPRR
jgi:hypothetical protein